VREQTEGKTVFRQRAQANADGKTASQAVSRAVFRHRPDSSVAEFTVC
jgi:hypothetical protein